MSTKYSRPNGWVRYGSCMLYCVDGAVQRALYLGPDSETEPLYPHSIKGSPSNRCTRSMLNDGYFILVDSFDRRYYDYDLDKLVAWVTPAEIRHEGLKEVLADG